MVVVVLELELVEVVTGIDFIGSSVLSPYYLPLIAARSRFF